MNVLERKKLKFRSFPVSEFPSFRVFFVRCRRTYILINNNSKKKLCFRSKTCLTCYLMPHPMGSSLSYFLFSLTSTKKWEFLIMAESGFRIRKIQIYIFKSDLVWRMELMIIKFFKFVICILTFSAY